MPHLFLERLALQREDVLKTRARDSRRFASGIDTGARAAEPRTRRRTTRRRARWLPW
jgi:hypothetical protein